MGWKVCGQDTDLFENLKIIQAIFVGTTPVEINDDDRDRITLNTKIQMLGKVTFVKKHWEIYYLRVSRYVLSFVIAWPVLKNVF